VIPDQSHQPSGPATPPDDEPLPPIPDGGLARVMPDWLRDDAEALAPARPRASSDPTGFLTEDDLPIWLRHLSPEGEMSVPPRPEAPVARAAAEPAPAARPPSPDPTPMPAPTAPPAAPATPPIRHDPGTGRVIPSPGLRAGGPIAPPPRDYRVIVAIIGGAILALGVLAYLYARGLL
jgi:hypothetical protein